uniref:Uncharacterized protein n=1 Tax=Glossina brevipalpis TaxID=37001 RepID=A0A1A9W527_9MUSC
MDNHGNEFIRFIVGLSPCALIFNKRDLNLKISWEHAQLCCGVFLCCCLEHEPSTISNMSRRQAKKKNSRINEILIHQHSKSKTATVTEKKSIEGKKQKQNKSKKDKLHQYNSTTLRAIPRKRRHTNEFGNLVDTRAQNGAHVTDG